MGQRQVVAQCHAYAVGSDPVCRLHTHGAASAKAACLDMTRPCATDRGQASRYWYPFTFGRSSEGGCRSLRPHAGVRRLTVWYARWHTCRRGMRVFIITSYCLYGMQASSSSLRPYHLTYTYTLEGLGLSPA